MLTILAISLERYFAICHPLRNYSMFSGSRVTKVILSVWLLGAVLSCPFIWVSQQVWIRFHDGRQGYVCESQFRKPWHHVYLCVMFACVFILPLLLLPIFYVKIIWTLVTHNLQGSADSRKNCATMRSRKQVIYILATVIVMFFVCVIPFRVFTLWVIFGLSEDNIQLPFEHYLNIFNIVRLLTYVNNAGNPIVYNVISTKFRVASLSVFRLSCGPKRGAASSRLHPFAQHTHQPSGPSVRRSQAGSTGGPTTMFAMKTRNGAGGSVSDPGDVRGGHPAGIGSGGSGSGNRMSGSMVVVDAESGRGAGFHGNNSTCTTWFQYSVDMNSAYDTDGSKITSTML
ncbi:unnamed protein product [Acanthosepion pharaonis]|uniref:G-protein coupled receptors family 1 profile domain-containing protein n=1 Tax=Acanthosepion pharaonis TaxID=158019 RepID=A0A812BY06_ACAPH|nr:unnamed protein product [Sepia pharaonis]